MGKPALRRQTQVIAYNGAGGLSVVKVGDWDECYEMAEGMAKTLGFPSVRVTSPSIVAGMFVRRLASWHKDDREDCPQITMMEMQEIGRDDG